MPHQRPADARALEVAAHDDGVLALDIVRIGREPRHAEQRLLLLVERDESHGPRIIDLREAGDEFVREFLAWGEEAKADVFRR